VSSRAAIEELAANPNSPEVAEFAATHRDRVELYQYLQWEVDRQLAAAAAAGRAGRLSLGLHSDLAVGVDPNGVEAWPDQELIAPGASIGAPQRVQSGRPELGFGTRQSR
jgi:4-alpha-glucanotransferase